MPRLKAKVPRGSADVPVRFTTAFKRDDGGAGVRRPERLEDPAPARCEKDAREELASPITGKWCCSCRQWLPVDAFRPNSNTTNGLDSWCRSCHAEAVRQWRAKNPDYLERYNARRRAEYRDEHPLTTRPCVVCGRPMTSRPTCSSAARNVGVGASSSSSAAAGRQDRAAPKEVTPRPLREEVRGSRSSSGPIR